MNYMFITNYLYITYTDNTAVLSESKDGLQKDLSVPHEGYSRCTRSEFWTSNLHLPIETGCWYDISREDRKCIFVGMALEGNFKFCSYVKTKVL